jgi:hypothetical protein
MSAPTPDAIVLAMLMWLTEAPEWDGWMPGSLLGRGKRANGWVTLVISLLGGWPLLFSLVWWGLCMVWGV